MLLELVKLEKIYFVLIYVENFHCFFPANKTEVRACMQVTKKGRVAAPTVAIFLLSPYQITPSIQISHQIRREFCKYTAKILSA